MYISRREAIKLLAGSVPWLGAAQAIEVAGAGPMIARGPFQATRESLSAYEIPAWFRDAKFGIWAHWGPQSVAECGDWYARNMYVEGCRQYRHHLANYGHPSKFGYKDLIATWRAEAFDPAHLVSLYAKAGAKYFVSLGVHVDNFDLWNSKHTRWNSVKKGPMKDIVGLFGRAARDQGLRFGVSDHLWCSYKWFSVAHGSDQRGPLSGVAYDGADPAYADLYGDCPVIYRDLPWNEEGIPENWKQHWFARIKDLIDQHEPDLLYCDGPIPFGDRGLSLVAHYYNRDSTRHGGCAEAVYTSKSPADAADGGCVLDVERDVVDGIWPQPWQMCTCIGNWHYDQRAEYKSPKRIIDLLVDTVSRNGNMLLNFPLRGNGSLDARELEILAEITRWMTVNGTAIFGTRPWKTAGVGPTVHQRSQKEKHGETGRKDLTAADVRFTTKGRSLFALMMGWPERRSAPISSLGIGQPYVTGRIRSVELLGHRGRLEWTHDSTGLHVVLPSEPPYHYAYALKIEGLET